MSLRNCSALVCHGFEKEVMVTPESRVLQTLFLDVVDW